MSSTNIQPPLPLWYREYLNSFMAGEAHCFLLYGDVAGYAYESLSQRAFLLAALANKCEVVAIYNRATGVSFATSSMEDKAKELLGLANTSKKDDQFDMGALLAASRGVPQAQQEESSFAKARRPSDALALLERLLRSKSGKSKVAIVIDYADTVCPPSDKSTMAPDGLDILVTLQLWGMDQALSRQNNPVFLITRQLAGLHPDLRASGSGYKAIELALPDNTARLEYLQWYLLQREKRNKSISLNDLTVEEMAQLTAGLNLRHLEDILLLAAKANGVDRSLVKGQKDAIITTEFSEVAEMIEPLSQGFAALGGMDRLIEWSKTEMITPLRTGRAVDAAKGVLLVGPPGTGKAQPLHAKILTPTGWKRMGSMHVGDEVIDPTTGHSTTVMGVYPQGMKAIYRVTFSDGSCAECCAEHLWLTQTRNARRDGGAFKVRTLAEIKETLHSTDSHSNHYIPLTTPLEFAEDKPLPLDPYLLGVLIGDGHFGTTRLLLTTADEEIVKHVRAVLPGGMVCERAATYSSYDYNIRRQKPYGETPWPKHSPLFSLLREMRMIGTRADDKHVPVQYLFASSTTRLAVLQGLLDSDGSVGSRDRYFVEFGTNSEQLARDVAFLVQSLGGTARISLRQRASRLSYRINIKLPADVPPFRLTRKANLYQPAEKYLPRRAIMSVDYVGEMEAQCIAVESPAQLYMTNDCLVTHNTFFVRALSQELGYNAVALRAENVLGGIVGESERKLQQFFNFARALAPVAIFVDELDQSDMSRRGNNSGNPVAANLFNAMLQFMSDETLRGKVIVIFASNRPDLIDPALLRFGRIDAIIPVLLPNAEARREIVLAQARTQRCEIDPDAATLLSVQADKYSAADIAAVVTKSRKLAQREERTRIITDDVHRAFRFITPATPQIADWYTLLAVQACNDAELLPPEYAQMMMDRQTLKSKIKAAQPEDTGPREERTW